MDYPGNLFVVAAPSGAGKSSLVKALLELDSHVLPSISHTTRPARGQEKHGREYFFVSNEEFDDVAYAHFDIFWDIEEQRIANLGAGLLRNASAAEDPYSDHRAVDDVGVAYTGCFDGFIKRLDPHDVVSLGGRHCLTEM